MGGGGVLTSGALDGPLARPPLIHGSVVVVVVIVVVIVVGHHLQPSTSAVHKGRLLTLGSGLPPVSPSIKSWVRPD